MNSNNLINEIKNKLSTKDKVELLKYLYEDISGKGIKGDTELAHVNKFESRILKMLGGSGTINPKTGLKQYFGGGGGGSAPSTQTQYVREAPGIEERKLELMDLAYDLTKTPEKLPAMQIAGLGALEQQGIQAAGVTGVGAPAVQTGLTNLQGAQTAASQGAALANLYGSGAVQQAGLTPTSSQFQQFLNPNQQYVIDAINRQMQQQQNQIASQAIQSGAFGGGREGIQRAELGALGLEKVGLAQQQAYNQAMQAFQNQQQLAAQTGLQAGQLGLQGGQLQAQTGLQAGQTAGQLGSTQQAMAQTDINTLMSAGGLQRQLAQATLDAQRQSTLQQQYEPYQRLEFLKNIYAAGPTSQSGITTATAPQTSPLAQSIGTGIGAFAAYQGVTGGQKQA